MFACRDNVFGPREVSSIDGVTTPTCKACLPYETVFRRSINPRLRKYCSRKQRHPPSRQGWRKLLIEVETPTTAACSSSFLAACEKSGSYLYFHADIEFLFFDDMARAAHACLIILRYLRKSLPAFKGVDGNRAKIWTIHNPNSQGVSSRVEGVSSRMSLRAKDMLSSMGDEDEGGGSVSNGYRTGNGNGTSVAGGILSENADTAEPSVDEHEVRQQGLCGLSLWRLLVYNVFYTLPSRPLWCQPCLFFEKNYPRRLSLAMFGAPRPLFLGHSIRPGICVKSFVL